MKSLLIIFIAFSLVLPVSAGRATKSAEKADKECVSFYEWHQNKESLLGRAHKVVEKMKEK